MTRSGGCARENQSPAVAGGAEENLMIKFSEEARQQTQTLLQAIAALPFNRELAAGTLARERFQHYITQDAIYLSQFSRALAIAAAKAPDSVTLQTFAQSALGAVAVEQNLHRHYLRSFGVEPATVVAAEPAPDCLAYTNFLLALAYHEAWEVLTAALLPCFWVYWDIGRSIAETANSDNPYRAWIETYADSRFGEAVQAVIAVADRAAATASVTVRGRMLDAFIRATQYEWLFWDGAYHRRGWPSAI
jgi:thiaminase/transcriptional activator TenA